MSPPVLKIKCNIYAGNYESIKKALQPRKKDAGKED